jgi:hypothetical protein
VLNPLATTVRVRIGGSVTGGVGTCEPPHAVANARNAGTNRRCLMAGYYWNTRATDLPETLLTI